MQVSLGKITCVTPGVPQRLTVNQSDPTAALNVHAYLIKWNTANAGKAYISLSPTDDRATLAQIISTLESATPSFTAGVSNEVDGLAAHRVYIDFDNGGDSVVVSAIIS